MSEKRKIFSFPLSLMLALLTSGQALGTEFYLCSEPKVKDGTQKATAYDPSRNVFFECYSYKFPSQCKGTPSRSDCFSCLLGTANERVGSHPNYKIVNKKCVAKIGGTGPGVTRNGNTGKTTNTKVASNNNGSAKLTPTPTPTAAQAAVPGANNSNTTGLNACLRNCSTNINNLEAEMKIAIGAIEKDLYACGEKKYKDGTLPRFTEVTNGCSCKKDGTTDLVQLDQSGLESKINGLITAAGGNPHNNQDALSVAYDSLKNSYKRQLINSCETFADNTGSGGTVRDCKDAKAGEKCSEIQWQNGAPYRVTGVKQKDGTLANTTQVRMKKNADGNYAEASETKKTEESGYYDSKGNKLKKVGNNFYKVDANGNLLDKNGKIIEEEDVDKINLVTGYSGEYSRRLADGSSIKYDASGNPTVKVDSKGNKIAEYKTEDGTTYISSRTEKGTTYNYDKDGNVTSASRKENGSTRTLTKQEIRKEERIAAKLANDECKVSAGWNTKWKCAGTQTMIDISQAQNQITQLAGAAGVQIAGRNAYNQFQQSGKQSDAYKGAADSVKSAKNAQVIVGVVNAAAFTALKTKQKQHQRTMAAIDGQVRYNEERAETYARAKGIKANDGTYGDAVADKMIEEQAVMEGKAKQQAVVHGFQGAVAIAQAIKLGRDQKMARDYANRLAEQEKKNGVISGNPLVVKDDPNGNSSAITGNDGGNTSVTGVDPNGDPNSGLGDGLGLGGDGGNMGGPPPGAKTLGGGGAIAGGAGGGGGGLGGGGAAVAPPDMTEGKAQPAEITEAKDRFEMGGGAITQSGGKAGGGGNDGGGLDFNNLLAQFLPKDEPSQQDGANNGILSYDGAAQRGIASVEQNNYLDQKTDIFDRLHKKYHGLAEAKRVSAE